MPRHRWLIALASRLVPRDMRAEWRAEWNAELEARERRTRAWGRTGGRRLDLLRRSSGAFWDALWLQSTRWYALRLFGRHWRMALTAWLSLSLAMAATVIGFAAYDVLLLRPPGVHAPASLRLIHVRTAAERYGMASYPEFQDYRARTRAFADIAAFPYAITSASFDGDGLAAQVTGTQVSANFFDVLGVVPERGELDFPADASDGRTMIVSDALWKRLGRPAGLVGTTVHLNGSLVAVIGVAPATFHGMTWGFSPDFWISLRTAEAVFGGSPSELADRANRTLHMIGRLAPGVREAQADADVQRIAASLSRERPTTNAGRSAALTAVSVTPPGDRSWMATVLGGLVLIVLLSLVVACANVTNLLLGLTASRRHEMLVRAALGASRLQLVVPAVRESAMLGVASGLTGCGVAWVALDRLATFVLPLGGLLPSISIQLRPDAAVLSAALAIALLAGTGVGLGPALRGAAEGLSGALTRETSVAEPRKARLRHALVVLQMAVAALAAVGIGVSIHSLVNLQRVPLGFSARHLTYADVTLPQGRAAPRLAAIYDRIRERLEGVPGLEAVALASDAPLTGYSTDQVIPEGRPFPAGGEAAGTPYAIVDDSYFSTIGMRVLQGRTFDSRDRPASTEVVVVNATLARSDWPGLDPIGRRLRVRNGNRLVTVIGVVEDGRYGDVDEAQLPFMYFALSQHDLPEVTVIARTVEPRDAVLRAIAQLQPDVAVSGVGVITLDDMLRLSLLIPRVIVGATLVFGLLALGLAVLGLYSTVFYSVSQRRIEIGIRTALGAAPRHLFALALKETGWVAGAGTLVGVAAGVFLLPLAASIFYGIDRIEPVVLGGVALTTAAVALLTTYLVVRPWTRAAAIELLRRS